MIATVWSIWLVVNILSYFMIKRSVKRGWLQAALAEANPDRYIEILHNANKHDVDKDIYIRMLTQIGLNIKIIPICAGITLAVILVDYF